MRRTAFAFTWSLAVCLASPALAQADGASANSDPWEHFNRAAFAVHEAIDNNLLRPLAMTYKRVLPRPLRDGIHNVLSNLHEPVVAANDILQGRFHQAGLTTGRLLANTTVGIGGVFDVASKLGAPHHDNDFDITLGRYHVRPGPYLFIPLLGPSSVRDLVGHGVDIVLDPLHWVSYPHQTKISVLRAVIGGLDTRVRVDGGLKALMSEATDPYATLRSVYIQNEESKIHAGEPLNEQPLPDFGEPTTPAAPTDSAPAPTPASPSPEPAPAASAPTAAVPPSP